MGNKQLNAKKESLIQPHGPLYLGWHATPKEFKELPHDGYGYQILNGVLHLKFGKSFEQDKIQKRIVTLIQESIGKDTSGVILEETNLFFPSGEILHPNISYFKQPIANVNKACIHLIPEMIVEILSSNMDNLENRMITYLKNGVKEYWLIEPKYKKISRFLNRNSLSWEIESGDRLTSEYLERLELNSNDLFHFFR